MPAYPVVLKPGPQRIAAALQIAGFSQSFLYPDVTDAAGKTWKSPSLLLLMTAIVGGETSGHVWVYHDNLGNTGEAESTDYGLLQINTEYQAEYFGAVSSSQQLNWAKAADNAVMGFEIWQRARQIRLANKGKMFDDFRPWKAWAGGGALSVRYQGRSWVDWAQYGVDQVNRLLAAGKSLEYAASVDLDPLVYWS